MGVLKQSYCRHYCDVFSGEQGYSCVVLMNAAIFNQIFVAAWQEFIATANVTAAKVFAICRLHPLNRCAVAEQPGSSTISTMFSGEVDADCVSNPGARGAGQEADHNRVYQPALDQRYCL